MNRLLTLLFFFISSVCLSGQTLGDERSAFFKRSNAAAQAYRARKNQELGDFLRRGWKIATESEPVRDPFRQKEATLPVGKPAEVPIEHPVKEEVISGGSFALPFYGHTYKVDYDRLADFALLSISESDVATAWDRLSLGASSLLMDCQSIKERAKLSDWAYLQLVDSLSTTIYPYSENERQLLFGFLLGKSGYNVRFGRSGEELTCLYGTEQIIYAKPYFFKDGIHYYRYRPGDQSLELSDPVPEGTRILDLQLTSAPAVGTGLVQEKHIKVGPIEFDYRIPQGLLDFYENYPHTEMFVKANAPVSEYVRENVYPVLKSAIDGKGEVESANILLSFAQGLMVHQSDEEHWGHEKWNFPDESIFYQCGDCDDHAILFARLAKDLLGLDVLLISCDVDGAPHATTAIRFNEPLDGDSILYENESYYCCEPSSTSARVGDRCWDNYVIKRIDKIR